MKGRFAYPLLFLLPSAMAAFLMAFVAAAAVAGVLWLFVFGDGTWPPAAEVAVMTSALIAFFLALTGLLFAFYLFGKMREASGGVSRRHVVLAVAASVLLPILALVHQWSVGNLG
jgi:hypothetical protein